MVEHIKNREYLIDFLKKELVGPFPRGPEYDCSKDIVFEEAAESYGPWRQKGSGEEILIRDNPSKRYGVGVLYPLSSSMGDGEAGDTSSGSGSPDAGVEEEVDDWGDQTTGTDSITANDASSGSDSLAEADPDDFDLSTANSFKPSSMGTSFLARFPAGATLSVEVSGGRYRRKQIKVKGKEYFWWLRSPVSIRTIFAAEDICAAAGRKVRSSPIAEENCEDLHLSIELFARKVPIELGGEQNGDQRLVTVSLVNRAPLGSSQDEKSLFQSHLRVSVVSPDGEPLVLPYPDPTTRPEDPEEQSLSLLYRNAKTYAIGHGCAVDWSEPTEPSPFSRTSGSESSSEQPLVAQISAESLPTIEIPSITPDVKREDGSVVEVPMAALAGLLPDDDGFDALEEVIRLYEDWIDRKQGQIPQLDTSYREAAAGHMEACRDCARRMRDGIQFLREDPTALKAFRLANHAILLQQIRPREIRTLQYSPEGNGKPLGFSQPYVVPDPLRPGKNRGRWRAFQIAFLLMSLRSTADGKDVHRQTVELIWFPTGGGKTEAYLGLASFAAFYRRLQNRADAGVNVVMRYTLRLLTAQQFQRASALLCAMEVLRRQQEASLGSQQFSIGIWLGGTTTPNSRKGAISSLRALQRGTRHAENPFILSRCPWCSGQMGPIELPSNAPKQIPRVVGYEQQGTTVVFKCHDSTCNFSQGLPIYVIDEDIYERRPSLVIGTVDKFAMLAWRPKARAIFGIDQAGNRTCSPPGLIIQDELHLISGPLGSMVGLYETVIDELCTDRRDPVPIPPKIVASTATIRRYKEQIKALYARDKVTLFPPPGLEVSDSFFSQYAKDESEKLQPGRIYVGVHAPGLGSMQTAQVRTFSSLLQAPMPLPEEEQDPWWTLLVFFNSLRELGTTLSLFQSDIPDYLKVLRSRMGLDYSDLRRVYSGNVLELTSRLRNDEVPKAISALEIPAGSDERSIEVCLASSIIEVGIDIDRLSLMAVVGQPKTTSQYIQVTGRVGRRWWERPGLVVTLYGASKPRDRSHFEKFRSYHERLYAQVEPTSVTPFSPPVLDRALHAAMVAYVRQISAEGATTRPYPYPEDLMKNLRKILLQRVETVDPAERENFQKVFDRRAEEWKRWERTEWTASPNYEDLPLMRVAGSYVHQERKRLVWSVPMSMRDVDAECQATITRLYAQDDGEEIY